MEVAVTLMMPRFYAARRANVSEPEGSTPMKRGQPCRRRDGVKTEVAGGQL